MHDEPFDAKYWRGRAEEALAAAMQLDDRDARLMLLDMAGTTTSWPGSRSDGTAFSEASE
jgi:hypothetical protein